MSPRRDRWVHAARVATVATLVVAVLYVVAVGVLDLVVTHRLTGEADARIQAELQDARQLPSATASAGPADRRGGDLDDVPVFVWRVPRAGPPQPVTAGAPALPQRRWSRGMVALTVGGTAFRLDATRASSGWLVAGQSVAEIGRVRSAFVLPEVVFGIVLLIATFCGSLLVGLRASAPVDLVRRRQAEFTADASHELRTPLSVIEAEVDLALRRPRGADEYAVVLRRIGQESERLRHIVDDLLWLARADSAPVEAGGVQPVNVATTVATCTERFSAVAERQGITLRYHHDSPERCMVAAAPEWIDRLAGVLIDNACHYAGVGGTVEVWVRGDTNRVSLSVDDSGPGIPAEQRAAVFERFHRSTVRADGAGLGLAIADSVVRMTDGVWTVGQGALGGAHMEISWRHGAMRRSSSRPDALLVDS